MADFFIEEDFVFRLDPTDTHKRRLTVDEIEYILSCIQPQKGIPPAAAISVVKTIKEPLRSELRTALVYPCIIPQLRSQIEEMYESTKISSGENIGVTAAQSFGQFYTQSTLNTFHTAGLAVKAVVSGVVRFEEILNTTTNPKSVSCSIKFKHRNSSILELRNQIKSSVVYFDISKIASAIYFDNVIQDEPSWYSAFEMFYNDKFRMHSSYVTIQFNTKIMYEYMISMEDVAKKIEDAYSDLYCVFSPAYIGIMHVYVDESLITISESRLHYITPDNMIEVYIDEVVIPNLRALYLSGIEKVDNAFFVRDSDDTWYLETEGGNFAAVISHPDVDMSRTMTNNIWDIYHTLGIEAVRQYILEELCLIMPGISVFHSRFLVDYMTRIGTLVSISRYTMRSEGSGALSKASFEETLDNLINAGLFGETENPDSVSTSIICGKLGSFGTGVCELKLDVSKLGNVMNGVSEKQ